MDRQKHVCTDGHASHLCVHQGMGNTRYMYMHIWHLDYMHGHPRHNCNELSLRWKVWAQL